LDKGDRRACRAFEALDKAAVKPCGRDVIHRLRTSSGAAETERRVESISKLIESQCLALRVSSNLAFV